MAHQWMRVNLAASIFPFATELDGRSIVVPQYDQNYNYLDQLQEPVKDRGIPQAFYMHNVLPTPQGYQSIAYDQLLPSMSGTPGTPTNFDTLFTLYETTPASARFLFSPAAGINYVYDAAVGNWASVSPLPVGTVSSAVLVTISFVNGQTYIYYANYGCLVYDQVGKVMTPTTLGGLLATDILGLCAANGYNIAWDSDTIAWSNAENPVDFVPSILTGAGGGTPQYIKGKILFCLPISGGFMIYCEKNVVSATYTGNIQFPFNFAEVAGSGGAVSPELVSWDNNLGRHYAWTTAGFQALSRSSAELVFPEVTSFIAAQIFEDFDETTMLLNEQYLSQQLFMKVAVVAECYLIISYGVVTGVYTHALVFDLNLKRWGKLKITHVKAFEWQDPTLYGLITYGQLVNTTYGALVNITYGQLASNFQSETSAKQNIAFLQADGTVLVLDFSLANPASDGVLMIGKFQFQRNKFIIHQRSDIESITPGLAFNFIMFYTVDGKTLQGPIPGTQLVIQNQGLNPKVRRYGCRIHGQNVIPCFIGAFNFTSYLVDFTLGGDR